LTAPESTVTAELLPDTAVIVTIQLDKDKHNKENTTIRDK
jgi:hypothetical protein